MTVEGIDVSHYQAATPSLAGLGFLIAKATEGTVPDERCDQHVRIARAAGLVVGLYHFARFDVDLAAQAAAFVARAQALRVELLAVDVEGPHALSLTATRAFVGLVHAAGLRCGLYHSDAGYFDAGQDWDWVANWTGTPPIRPWTVWQYRGSPLDRDLFRGSLDELRALAGETMSPIAVGSLYAARTRAQLLPGDQVYDETFRPLERVKTAQPADVLFPTGTGWQAIAYRPATATPGVAGLRCLFVRTADLGDRLTPVPVPPADCSEPIAAAVAADRSRARIVYG